MGEYEGIALTAARESENEQAQETMRKATLHVVQCPVCRDAWNVEDLLRKIPSGVWETHLETIDMKIRQMRDVGPVVPGPKPTEFCVTMGEFQALCRAVSLGTEKEEKLANIQRHLLTGCPWCRPRWNFEELIKNFPGSSE